MLTLILSCKEGQMQLSGCKQETKQYKKTSGYKLHNVHFHEMKQRYF